MIIEDSAYARPLSCPTATDMSDAALMTLLRAMVATDHAVAFSLLAANPALARAQHAEHRTVSGESLALVISVFRVNKHVGDMNRSDYQGCSSDQRASAHWDWMLSHIFLPFR